MSRLMLIFLLLAAAMSTGCEKPYTEAPKPTNYFFTEQKMVQSMYHWERTAGEVANEIEYLTEDQDYCYEIYISPAADSSFEKAYREYLKSSLTEKCFSLCPDEDCYLKLDFQTQVVHHPSFPVNTGFRTDQFNKYNRQEHNELIVSNDLHYKGKIVGTITRTLYFKDAEMDNYLVKESVPVKTYNVTESN